MRYVLRHFTLIRTLLAILIAIAICTFVIALVSSAPRESLKVFFLGPLQNRRTLGMIFEIASPIVFGGLAIAVSFTAGQFYIGAEGALYLGAAIGTAVGISTVLPWYLHVPVVLFVSALAGGAWAFVPGYLKARFNASEIVNALMLNFVALFAGLYLINYHFRDLSAGFMVSLPLPESAWLVQFVEGTRIHWGIALALLMTGVVYAIIFHTKVGYEIRMVGHNIRFARYGGVNTFRVIVTAHVMTGIIAGFGGVIEVMGIHRRFNWQSSPGFGWDGVVVAIIGRNHPFLIVPASLFLAYLRVGGQQLKLMSDVPGEIVLVIQAIVILLITAEAFLSNWKKRVVIKQISVETAAGEAP